MTERTTERRWGGARAITCALSCVLFGALGAACDRPPPRAAPVDAPRPDKEALFGDPMLVPSRAGERAREELALAGEIERLIAEDPAIDAVRVHVRAADDDAKTPAQIVVVARAESDAALDRERCERLAREVVGDPAARVDVDLVVGAAPAAETAREPVRDLLLALALLALGASAGITLDRVRRPVRRR